MNVFRPLCCFKVIKVLLSASVATYRRHFLHIFGYYSSPLSVVHLCYINCVSAVFFGCGSILSPWLITLLLPFVARTN